MEANDRGLMTKFLFVFDPFVLITCLKENRAEQEKMTYYVKN